MRIPSLLAVACLLFALAAARSAALQGPTVSGVVVNDIGHPVAGATVELRQKDVTRRSTITDAAGAFRFESVAAGNYVLLAAIGGVTNSTTVNVRNDPVQGLRLTLRTAATREANEPGPLPRMAAEAAVSADKAAGRGGASRQAMVVGALAAPPPPGAPVNSQWNTEAYARIDEGGFRRAADQPLSTFSVDVDTASYANVRRFLNEGRLPPADAVRIEELINYFRFDYGQPAAGTPFAITTELASAPWAPGHRIVLVGLQAPRLSNDSATPRNLVFLLDVSGSMTSADKLPLVKTAMRMLADTLRPNDRVAIVTYAGSSGLVLPSTAGDRKERIQQAIADLRPGGSTNGAAGIQLAYHIAAGSFVRGGINRVILATDGDFNVGVTSEGELTRLIEAQRERGIFLSVLGVGTGNLKDATMERLADRGNGNYAYLDSLHEARRVLIAEAGATLVTVAKDVKIQVEFNPALVGAYRLIGYENRMLAAQDFNDDRKDAGEIGAGHTVTALYEIVPPGAATDAVIGQASVDPLRYQRPSEPNGAARSGELMTVKLRYKKPDGDTSALTSVVVRNGTGALTPNLGFAAAVAEFGMLLRRSERSGAATWKTAAELARRHRGEDADGYRAEFVRLVELAAALDAQSGSSAADGMYPGFRNRVD
jgi:Ca-activated chloride channel family protein